MGENSKRIGETGEEVVANFLKLIGWNDPQRNIDITSMDTEHRKYSNGLDGYFHYISPMISNTVENILYSCKYSTDPYPVSQVVKLFKEHYTDLAKTIESFRKSELNQNTQRMHENIDTYFDRGVLFWLNNSGKGENDLISRLDKIDLNTGINHNGIFLVDNKRIQFIYDSINYARNCFTKGDGFDVDFIYFTNGLNNDERNMRNGKILPVQYINTSVLPMRASKNNETTVIIFSIDNFDKNDLMKFMGIAKNIGCNVQGATQICFPDYNETEHLPEVNNMKQIFNDASFTANLTVTNYNNPILR